jgi:hypothetical protein
MVDWIEAGVSPVDEMEEREYMHAAESAGKRTVEESPEVAESPTRQSIDVRDELRLILHQESRNPSVAVRNRQRAGLESAS